MNSVLLLPRLFDTRTALHSVVLLLLLLLRMLLHHEKHVWHSRRRRRLPFPEAGTGRRCGSGGSGKTCVGWRGLKRHETGDWQLRRRKRVP